MGAFEDFVNVELPLRISTNEDDGSGNLPVDKILITTGVGKGVVTGDAPALIESLDDLDDVDINTTAPTIGQTLIWDGVNWVPEDAASGGGSTVPFDNPTQITYDELIVLINTDAVSVGTFYEITDYQTVNDAGGGHINTGNIEHIIVQGIYSNAVSSRAYSTTHQKDIIEYDIFADGIISDVSGEWEDNESTGDDDIIITNWTSSSFDMNRNPIMDDTFYIYAEDDEGDVEYEYDGEGDDFTITDLGGGQYRFTDLTGDINFTHPDYNYMEISFRTKMVSRKGYITYRKYPDQNIEAKYDFRNCKFTRFLVDASGLSEWDSAITYNVNAAVIRNGRVYISLAGLNHNQDPASKATYWCIGLRDIATEYYSTIYSIKMGGVYLNRRNDEFVLMPTFAKRINATTYEFNIDKVTDVSIYEEGNVFVIYNDYVTLDNIILQKKTTNNTFFGQVTKFVSGINTQRFTLGKDASINDIVVSQNLNSVTMGSYSQYSVLGRISQTNFGSATYSDIKEVGNCVFSHIVRAKIGYANYYLNMYCDDLTMGGNNRNIFISHGNFITFGNSNRNIEVYSFAFSNCKFGDLNRYMRFNGGTTFETHFGTNNGRNGTWLLFNGTVRGLNVGNDCFYLGQSGPFNTTVQNVELKGNNSRLHISGQFVDCVLGIGAGSITCHNIQRTTIGNGTSQITVPVHIYDCTWAAGLNWFQYTGNGNFLKNRIYATHVDFGNSATHIMNNYYCDVVDRPDGTHRLTYIDNADNIVVDDVTN